MTNIKSLIADLEEICENISVFPEEAEQDLLEVIKELKILDQKQKG